MDHFLHCKSTALRSSCAGSPRVFFQYLNQIENWFFCDFTLIRYQAALRRPGVTPYKHYRGRTTKKMVLKLGFGNTDLIRKTKQESVFLKIGSSFLALIRTAGSQNTKCLSASPSEWHLSCRIYVRLVWEFYI